MDLNYKRIFVGSAACLLLGCSSVAGSGNSALTLSADTLGVYAVRSEDINQAREIRISPSGKYLIISTSQRTSGLLANNNPFFLVIHLACYQRLTSIDKCMLKVESLDGVRVAAWGKDDEYLYLVENSTNIVGVALRFKRTIKASFFGRAALPRSIGSVAENVGRASSQDVEAEAQAIINRYDHLARLLPDRERVLKFSSDQVGPFFVTADPENLETFVVGKFGRIQLPVTRPFLSTSIDALSCGSVLIIADQKWTLTTSVVRPRVPSEPNCNSRHLALEHSQIKAETARVYSYLADAKYVDDAIPRSNEQGQVLVISEATDNSIDCALSLRKFIGGRTSIAGKCKGRPFRVDGDLSSFDTYSGFKVSRRQIGSHEWPLELLVISKQAPAGIVLFYGGGPAESIERFIDPPLLAKEYLEHGWTVAFVGYSASAGGSPSTTKRVAARGVEAFKRDAALTRRFVDSEFPNVPVIAHGESFGAGPALAAEATLTERRGAIVTVVPYLRPRAPEELQSKGPFSPINVAYQSTWERVVLGFDGRERRALYADDLRQLSMKHDANRQARVILSSIDAKSKPSDIPLAFSRNATVKVVTLEHGLVVSSAAAKGAVDAAIEQSIRR